MANIFKTCEICGTGFFVLPYRSQTARFCSRSCRASWVGTLPHNKRDKPWLKGNKFAAGNKPNHKSFKVGHRTWNDGVKGIHLSPKTEFKSGPRPERRSPLGTISIRKDKMGRLRAYVKVSDPNKWKLRAVKVWEDINGPVPPGHLIHHDDRDTLNDDSSNLICLTRAQHLDEHRSEHNR